VFTILGLVMRSPQATMNAGFMAIFPITFLSNVFVDPSTLPSVLEAFVNVNPVSHLVTAARGVMDGNPDWDEIALVLGVAAALTLVCAPITARMYRRR
jgi:ABC-2 type transport system permease protein